MRCITVLYPHANNEVDFEHYRKVHAPLIVDVLGKALHRLEVRRGVSSPDGSQPPMYAIVVNIWIADDELYETKIAARQQELIDDVKNFTKVMPTMQIDEVFFSS